MTPQNKDEAVGILSPWLKSPSDVFGRDDILGLLSRHPAVERRHIKLWLTSADVLQAIVNGGIVTRTQAQIDRLKRQLRLWVPNDSFSKAKEILENGHICVISGGPGIGKTMLADVLMADYSTHGYEPVVISADIEEGDQQWARDRKQLFYYDDFLGRVSFGELQLRKNEEARLVSFIRRVRSSPTKRFILTTREYILNEAHNRYERLHEEPFPLFTYILSLGEYTPMIRAKILYNHLYFSSLPPELRTALLTNRTYMRVVEHSNYSPRLIEQAIELPATQRESPAVFRASLMSALDDPSRIWDRIFESLPENGRLLLLVLSSFPPAAFSDDLERAYRASLPEGSSLDSVGFLRALRMIEGTFVRIERADTVGDVEGRRVVTFRDPSVGDYMRSRLRGNPVEADQLAARSVFFEQCMTIWDSTKSPNLDARGESLASTIADTAFALLGSPTPVSVKLHYQSGGDARVRARRSLERRSTFLVNLASQALRVDACKDAATEACNASLQRWKQCEGSKGEALSLLDVARRTSAVARNILNEMTLALHYWFTTTLTKRQDFARLVDLADAESHLFQPPNPPLESYRAAFAELLSADCDCLLNEVDDPSEIEWASTTLERVAAALLYDASDELQRLAVRIAELHDRDAEDDGPGDAGDPPDPPIATDEKSIDAMFESLREPTWRPTSLEST